MFLLNQYLSLRDIWLGRNQVFFDSFDYPQEISCWVIVAHQNQIELSIVLFASVPDRAGPPSEQTVPLILLGTGN